MNDLFAPPGEPWVAVSERLRSARTLVVIVVGGLVTIVGSVLAALWTAVAGIGVLVVGVALMAIALVLVGRNWRSWGYAERPDDLYVTNGVMFRRLVVVPYGRMQYVDVTAGPLQRLFRIATVELHTATPATDAVVRGLPPPDAARLRDRLTERGGAESSGL